MTITEYVQEMILMYNHILKLPISLNSLCLISFDISVLFPIYSCYNKISLADLDGA